LENTQEKDKTLNDFAAMNFIEGEPITETPYDKGYEKYDCRESECLDPKN
jgi:hypothetical protein